MMSQCQKAYEAGKDCGLNGPNTTNCHFRHFATRELTNNWERGKAFAEKIKEIRERRAKDGRRKR